MLVHVKLCVAGVAVDQLLAGTNAADVLHQAKLLTAKKIGGMKGFVIRKMGDMAFAAKAVSLYNKAEGLPSGPPPKDADAFLAWATRMKLAEVKDENDSH
jgi:hypothetical protein